MDNGNSNEPISSAATSANWFGNFHVLKDINLKSSPGKLW